MGIMKFELFKQQNTIRGASTGGNPMQDARKTIHNEEKPANNRLLFLIH